MFVRIARVTLLVGALVMTMMAPPAFASHQNPPFEPCNGTVVDSFPAHYDGEVIGRLRIYRNDDWHCAEFWHAGASYGVARDTYVYIVKCEATSSSAQYCTEIGHGGPDHDQYSYYAGGVRVLAGSHCIQANGWVYWQGARRKAHTPATSFCQP
ncbi:MAG TPA: hypothetical protein VFM37_07500 [Pseudonocardiaceae bacterium]|nr:hypothetical protein [Pseudonocardiaceae bacterium]